MAFGIRHLVFVAFAFGIWHLAFAFGIWHLAFGIWHLAFGVWHLAFAFAFAFAKRDHGLLTHWYTCSLNFVAFSFFVFVLLFFVFFLLCLLWCVGLVLSAVLFVVAVARVLHRSPICPEFPPHSSVQIRSVSSPDPHFSKHTPLPTSRHDERRYFFRDPWRHLGGR